MSSRTMRSEQNLMEEATAMPSQHNERSMQSEHNERTMPSQHNERTMPSEHKQTEPTK